MGPSEVINRTLNSSEIYEISRPDDSKSAWLQYSCMIKSTRIHSLTVSFWRERVSDVGHVELLVPWRTQTFSLSWFKKTNSNVNKSDVSASVTD